MCVCVCVCVREREKNNSFEIRVIILRYIRNLNLPFKKDFEFAETVFRDCPKNGEGNKLRRRRKYMQKSN